MSFSKARIQRFNEFENAVPPPGSYDPKFDSKVKGPIIEKSERFHDNKSVDSAECNVSVCSKSTCNAVVNFRTPQPPRKNQRDRTPKSGPTRKLRALITPTAEQKVKYDSDHQLLDLRVECSNKDKTIQEMEKHIEDMKEQTWQLETQLEELRKKQLETEEQHRKDIETMAKLQQEVLYDHDETHQAEIERLRCQLLEVSKEKEREIEARKIMDADLRNRITDVSKRATALESELTNKRQASSEKIKSLETQIMELTSKLENVAESHKREVNSLEQEMSKLNLCISDLTNERDKLELKSEKQQNVILELQAQLSTLQCELDELKAQYDKLVETSSKRIDELRHIHRQEVDDLESHFKKQMEVHQNEKEDEICRRKSLETKAKDIDEKNNFLTRELEDIQRLYKDVNHRLCLAHQELEEADRKHNLVLKKQNEDLANIMKLHDEEILKLKEQLESARSEYLKEIENLTMTRDQEILKIEQATAKRIEEETTRIKQLSDKKVENAEALTKEALTACRTECQEKVKKVIAESDAKVNAMIKEAKATVEEEMRLTAGRYKICLAQVERERTALDEKLTQKDSEIARLSVTLEDLKSSAQTQESFGQSLQMELDRAESELIEKKEELKTLSDQIRAEAVEMVARRKRFEVVMAENQASVAALTTRLAESNSEVERLQHELKNGEDCISEHRNLLSIMRSNSQMVHEQVQVLMDQLDAKRGLIRKLEVESLNEVETLKSIFEAKFDDFKQLTIQEVAKLKADCDKKTAQNVEMKSQLHEMASHLTDAQNMLLKLEERNDSQELEVVRLELLNKKLSGQLEEREAVIEDTSKMLEAQSKKHEATLNKTNAKIQELCEKVKCLEERDTHVKENIEFIEEERNMWQTLENRLMEELAQEKARREAIEEELKKLAEHNELLVKDYQEISEKYAEVVGHQNLRQRIKHVSQLKDKLYQLEQELLGKNRIIEGLHKTIAKLKAEEKRANVKGKENMLGISKSSDTTPICSPHKTLTPLKNWNGQT